MKRAGPQIAVEELVEHHYEMLYRYAYRLSGSAADAEDLVQETFVRAQAKLGQVRDVQRVSAWLFSILRNLYLQRLRSARQAVMLPLEDIAEPCEEPSDALPEIDQEQLQAALNELPESFRTPLILFYFDELSYREIAEEMDLPIGTVMSRLARAKGHLRARLHPGFVGAGSSPGTDMERRQDNGV